MKSAMKKSSAKESKLKAGDNDGTSMDAEIQGGKITGLENQTVYVGNPSVLTGFPTETEMLEYQYVLLEQGRNDESELDKVCVHIDRCLIVCKLIISLQSLK